MQRAENNRTNYLTKKVRFATERADKIKKATEDIPKFGYTIVIHTSDGKYQKFNM